jgi:hypothetical protein
MARLFLALGETQQVGAQQIVLKPVVAQWGAGLDRSQRLAAINRYLIDIHRIEGSAVSW